MAFIERQSQDWRERVERILENPDSWPPVYTHFYQLWGYLNAYYDAHYTEHYPGQKDQEWHANKEWKKIARFALDKRHDKLWQKLVELDCLQHLAQGSCVGDGRDGYEPDLRVMISFRTLRQELSDSAGEISVEDVCQGELCESRTRRCLNKEDWEEPQESWDRTDERRAKFEPLGAVFTILYQLRNNLFHGSKLDFNRGRNRELICYGVQILQHTLHYLSENGHAD